MNGFNGATIDGSWFLAVIGFAQHTPWLHAVLHAYTDIGIVLFAVLLVAAWWIARATPNPRMMAAIVWTPIAVLLAYAISSLIKLGVNELRPCRAFPHTPTILPCPPLTDYSFPSNHAVLAAAAATALLLIHRRIGITAAILALLMGFSRIYVGVHYPHDVLAGFVLGAALAITTIPASRLLARPIATLRNGRMAPLLGGSRTNEHDTVDSERSR